MFYLTNNFNKAMEFCQRAIEVRPESETYHLLGGILDKVKKYEEAIECWEKSIQLKPNFC